MVPNLDGPTDPDAWSDKKGVPAVAIRLCSLAPPDCDRLLGHKHTRTGKTAGACSLDGTRCIDSGVCFRELSRSPANNASPNRRLFHITKLVCLCRIIAYLELPVNHHISLRQ